MEKTITEITINIANQLYDMQQNITFYSVVNALDEFYHDDLTSEATNRIAQGFISRVRSDSILYAMRVTDKDLVKAIILYHAK